MYQASVPRGTQEDLLSAGSCITARQPGGAHGLRLKSCGLRGLHTLIWTDQFLMFVAYLENLVPEGGAYPIVGMENFDRWSIDQQ